MHAFTTSLGSLTCRVIQGDDAPAHTAVILCHGYGAPGDDLVPLGAELMEQAPSLRAGVRFIFPEALLGLAQFGGGARAWWDIDIERRIAIQSRPEGVEQIRDEVPAGLSAARRALLGLIDAVTHTGLDIGRIVLGGFSQGAMLATDVAFTLDEPCLGLCVLSGSLISRKEWTVKAARRAKLPVFQSHGTVDPILRYPDAEALRDLLTRSGIDVDFVSFAGGHAIPAPAFHGLAKFLVDRVGRAPPSTER